MTGDAVRMNRPTNTRLMSNNSHTLAALARQAGAEAITYPIVPDRLEALQAAAAQALAEADMLVMSAGSSVSVRDMTAQVIAGLGQPGILVHGVSVKPGKPTILAVCEGKPVVGLPGNPVSALVIARFFIKAMLERLLGLPVAPVEPGISARLTVNLASQAGREDWWPVRLIPSADGMLAEPVFYKSNLIFTYMAAQGLIKIPADANGLAANTRVDVYPLYI